MERVIHHLQQGTDAWHRFRLEHFGASEAAAMLGLSEKVTRTELLKAKHTGIAKEYRDWVQKNILDRGHELEAAARPIVEEMIGEELYPATYSMGRLSASCDGLTMDGETAFEHKQWNAALAASVARGELPEEHQPQCQQILMVTGAKRVIFAVSDGTRENFVHMEVRPDPAWQERIMAGWNQFEEDLRTYTPVEVLPPAVPAPIQDLPALAIEITGRVVASNLAQWRDVVTARIAEIKTDLQSDQDFADADKMVKFLDEGEKRIDLVKAQAQAQASDIDAVFRALDEIKASMRARRLELDRMVKARKEAIRIKIQQQAKDELAAHIAALNKRLGAHYMPPVPADFAGAMKGKKTIASLRDAVDTELACAKIEANAIADRIDMNRQALKGEAHDWIFLFPDFASTCTKAADDFAALLAARIAAHKENEAKRLEAEREKIRKEEQEKLAREQAAPAAVVSVPAATVATPTAQVNTGSTIKLGEICTRLGFTVTADFLAVLGFQAVATERAAKLYREADFPRICAALVSHIQAVSGQSIKRAA